MKNFSKTKAIRFIQAYLENKPAFYIFIRPAELLLFDKHKPFKAPVLDFGCGDGFFTQQMLKRNEKIAVGVDIDSKEIFLAGKRNIYKKLFTLENWKLPFPDNRFSTVISNCVFEHVENIDKTLSEIFRVTKRGGVMYCTVMTDVWNEHLLGRKLLGKKYLKWMKKVQRHPNLYSVKKWDKVFSNSGFSVVEKTGYSGKPSSRKNELFHFLSFDSLLTKKMFGKWVVAPWRFNLLNLQRLALESINFVQSNKSSAVFYVLQKKIDS